MYSSRACVEHSVPFIWPPRQALFCAKMKGDGAALGGPAPKAASAVDERFSAVHTDPRFQRFPRKQRHVEIDERFAGQCRRKPIVAGPAMACRNSVEHWIERIETF